MTDPLSLIGLDLVAARLQDHDLGTLTAEPIRTVLGRAGLAGSSRPLPSSAALLRLGDDASLWVPAPVEAANPKQGQAPLYLHGGRELVLPTIRLFRPLTLASPPAKEATKGSEKATRASEGTTVEYLTLSDWLYDAITLWQFDPIKHDDGSPIRRNDNRPPPPPRSLLHELDRLRPPIPEVLDDVATFVFYALFGADGPSIVRGLRLPAGPMWLRPVGETAFARTISRSLVVTARLHSGSDHPAIPSTNLRAAGYRITPALPRDWGLDPVHTPEGNDIRLTGRLGAGVALHDRKLCPPKGERPPLSASTARLPFAGYDDPRRLLMAANMQAHAVPLTGEEPPRVSMGGDGQDPPGVNLRIAYLAWQGWNHEDAWVLSQSAALRLGTVETLVRTIAIRAIELAPELLVKIDQPVERGQLLVRRLVAPALLCADLRILAEIDDFEETMPLRSEVDDFAPESGTVARIEEWDLHTGRGIPKDWLVSEGLDGAFRSVIRIHIERSLPLAIGDKLANRHGHKGIVGAIVPDDEMPHWRGKPLEALIDPISVLNRSNWGQVYEALAGALVEPGPSNDVRDLTGARVLQDAQAAGADESGCWPIEPPNRGDWLKREVRTVAGVQFVMRMPHHACDKISGNPPPPRLVAKHLRRRSQRLGEMEHWALWAHAKIAEPGDGSKRALTADTLRFARLLESAGFRLSMEGDVIVIRRLPLHEAPPADYKVLSIEKETRPRNSTTEIGDAPDTKVSLRSLDDLYDALDEVTPAAPTVLLLDPPVTIEERKTEGEEARPPITVNWLPLLPACDRPKRRLYDGSQEPHELTADLRRVLRSLLRHTRACQNRDAWKGIEKSTKEGDEKDLSAASKGLTEAEEEVERHQRELSYAVRRLMNDAYGAAVGHSATGQFSSKRSYLRRGLLGRRLSHSARATVSPGGALRLALDEIGLPPALAHTLFGPKLPQDEKAVADAVNGRRVWLKRDPVLHRWGLLPVRVRIVPSDTIRMPASLLGPLGADFDGDTVALFASLPDSPSDFSSCSPPALAWHPIVKDVMFKPGKQYQYGLSLLGKDAERLTALQNALRGAGAPDWPSASDPKKALAEWTELAVKTGPQGLWWAILEYHALCALATNPTMEFRLGNVDELARLEVVRCGAAKDLYGGVEPPKDEQDRLAWEKNRQAMTDILDGKSLDLYCRRENETGIVDPIADVMVAAKASIGQFGGALRRLVYTAGTLRPEDIQKAQTLTEQVTQKALSVKAGKPPLKYADFERQLRRLLQGRQLNETEQQELRALLAEVGKTLEPVWKELGTLITSESKPWLEWLRKPHELAEQVDRAGELRLPVEDLRLRCWLNESPK
jgi:hypothetical protein